MQIDYNYSDNLSILCPTLSFGSSGGGRSCTGSQTYKNTKKLASEKSSEVAAHSNLEEYGVTLYKGALVVAVDWMESSAVSFGVIFIGSDNLNDPEFADTLNHEYGHFVHLTQIGVVAYTATTALPSLVGAGLSYYVPFIDQNYMSQPWERIANQLGGVNDVYLPGADTAGALYYYFTLLVSAVIP